MIEQGYRLESSEVKTFMVRMICDCGGEFMTSGVQRETYPPQNQHVCNQCSKVVWMRAQAYPAVQYRAAGEQSLDRG